MQIGDNVADQLLEVRGGERGAAEKLAIFQSLDAEPRLRACGGGARSGGALGSARAGEPSHESFLNGGEGMPAASCRLAQQF